LFGEPAFLKAPAIMTLPAMLPEGESLSKPLLKESPSP
jgi:hypothetical protein